MSSDVLGFFLALFYDSFRGSLSSSVVGNQFDKRESCFIDVFTLVFNVNRSMHFYGHIMYNVVYC